MAMHFNASNSNQIGQLLSLQSNFGLNQSGLISSDQLTTGLHQNELFSQRTHPNAYGLGQLGLAQRVTHEIRTTYVTPQRVQIHTVIDYIPLQNQSFLPLTEVTEIVKTQLLTATSTRERIFNPFAESEPPFHYQNPRHDSSHYRNLSQIPSYGQNNPSHLQNQSYNNLSLYQNYPLRNRATLHVIDQDEPTHEAERNGVLLDPEPVSVYIPATNKDPNPSTNQLGSPNSVNTDHISDDDHEDEVDEGDGRTHSLPCRKYGPYTCPKCKGVFSTSQSFAAHMGSHYKYESRGEKMRRRAAKYKRKNLRLVQMVGGLTVVPDSSFKTTGNRRRNNNATRRAEDQKDEAGLRNKKQDPHSEVADEEGLFEVQIKEEPMELMP